MNHYGYCSFHELKILEFKLEAIAAEVNKVKQENAELKALFNSIEHKFTKENNKLPSQNQTHSYPYKVKMCRYFPRCPKKDKCTFAHSKSECDVNRLFHFGK
jgi:hypothetical protein